MSEAARKIVVEALIRAPVQTVWERTQDPEQHLAWDIRFTDIRYREDTDASGFRLMDYRTDVGFGIEVAGTGRYLHDTPLRRSTFRFDSDDWKSIIRDGRGIWLYEERSGATCFKTVYDYDHRHGAVGRFLDRWVFRRLMQLATEWGFETLRLWCAGDDDAPRRRGRRSRFLLFYVRRMLGGRPAPGAARSWLGSGRPEESGGAMR